VKEKLAALAVLVSLLSMTGAIFWYRATREPLGYQPGDKIITLTGYASSGVWTTEDINGLNYWWKDFEPAIINLETGDWVVLRLVSADLMHQFYAPHLRVGPVDVKPGHVAEVRFQVPESGMFQYYCTANCGFCHFYMRGWIVVTNPGEEPTSPPDILCPLCLPEFGPPPPGPELVPLGEYLYLAKGCSTCHGFEGRGGIENENFTSGTVPAHNRTAEKFFLQDPDEVEAFIGLLQEHPGLATLPATGDISRGKLVEARLVMARDIITMGKFSARMDSTGPVPPLQMPAWEYIISEREMESLLAYFVSLMPWDEDEQEDDL